MNRTVCLIALVAIVLAGLSAVPAAAAAPTPQTCAIGFAACVCVAGVTPGSCQDKWGDSCDAAIGLDADKEPVACRSDGQQPDQSGACIVGEGLCLCVAALGQGPCHDKWGDSCDLSAGLDADKEPVACRSDGTAPDQSGACVLGEGLCFCVEALGQAPCHDKWGDECAAVVGVDADKEPVLC